MKNNRADIAAAIEREEQVMDEAKHAAGIAVITGAAGGMGAAAARLMAAEGWPLLLCDLDAGRLERVAEPLHAATEILAADISDAEFPAHLAAALGERPIGAVIHTAGLSPTMAGPARILEVNLDATVRLVDMVRSRMSDGSATVLISSMASYFPTSPEADAAFDAPLPPEGAAALLTFAPTSALAYTLSKRAVRRLVEREAAAFGRRKARIVSISPGLIDTPMGRAEITESAQARALLDRAALPRLGKPEEIAAVAMFLCSPGASYITGCDIRVDAGTLAALGL
jgi:NAD(P)-dependent dehydrogenase (short-subunit alcohol dehydrogenase family)